MWSSHWIEGRTESTRKTRDDWLSFERKEEGMQRRMEEHEWYCINRNMCSAKDARNFYVEVEETLSNDKWKKKILKMFSLVSVANINEGCSSSLKEDLFFIAIEFQEKDHYLEQIVAHFWLIWSDNIILREILTSYWIPSKGKITVHIIRAIRITGKY